MKQKPRVIGESAAPARMPEIDVSSLSAFDRASLLEAALPGAGTVLEMRIDGELVYRLGTPEIQ